MNDTTDYKQASPPLLGTWEYVLDSHEGLCVYTETHVFWILVDKERKPFQGDQPTETEKAQAFVDAWADASTYTFTAPSRVAIHRLFSTYPSASDFEFEYEIAGDVMEYWVLRPDGSRGPVGRARKLEA